MVSPGPWIAIQTPRKELWVPVLSRKVSPKMGGFLICEGNQELHFLNLKVNLEGGGREGNNPQTIFSSFPKGPIYSSELLK